MQKDADERIFIGSGPRPKNSKAVPAFLRRHDVRLHHSTASRYRDRQHGIFLELGCAAPTDAPGHTDLGLYSQSPLGFHYPAQAEGTPYFKEGMGFAKFNCFWTIQLEAGYSLYVTHPSNRYDPPFRTINGLVDADTYNEVFINFPVLWVEPNFKGVLKKGTPVAQCIAIQRQPHELDIQAMNSEDAAKFLPLSLSLAHGTNVYKNQFRAKKP